MTDQEFFVIATSSDKECLKALSSRYNFETQVHVNKTSQLLVERSRWDQIDESERHLIEIHARGFIEGWDSKEY